MDILLYIGGAIFVVAGLIGCILPALPGPPLSFIGILLLHFTEKVQLSTTTLLVLLAIVIIVEIFDYFLPVWFTKKFGGSKFGVWGSIIGMFIGFFFSPWGIAIGPFLGAVIGELIEGKKTASALKSGFGSFLGFILTTGAKIAIGFTFIWMYIKYAFLN